MKVKSDPIEALIFFRLLLSSCLNWKIYWDDHSSLSRKLLLLLLVFSSSDMELLGYYMNLITIIRTSRLIMYNLHHLHAGEKPNKLISPFMMSPILSSSCKLALEHSYLTKRLP